MHHFDILLPFGLPIPEIGPDLLRELNAPALSTLLARANTPLCRTYDPFLRSLPHETWLAARLGLASSSIDNSPPIAISRMRNLNLTATDGNWFLLQPVHIHVARDHLVLTDGRRSRLSDTESRALFDAALPLFEEAGKTLLYGDANAWFVRADDWSNLQTATPDAACGHNIDIWMPQGEGERAWRKLQNEVQMEWHEHPVNTARADQRLPPVNSLWLWGGSAIDSSSAPAVMHDWPGIATSPGNLANMLSSAPTPHLLVLDQLCEAALAEDWAEWLECMRQLENIWFAPLLTALRDGTVASIHVIVSHHAQLREFSISKRSLLKFWAKPSLSRLS